MKVKVRYEIRGYIIVVSKDENTAEETLQRQFEIIDKDTEMMSQGKATRITKIFSTEKLED